MLKQFKENNIIWTRYFKFYFEWKHFPFHFEVLTWEGDKYNGHICFLNFALYWHSEGKEE